MTYDTRKLVSRKLITVAREVLSNTRQDVSELSAIENLAFRLVEIDQKYQQLLNDTNREKETKMDRALSSGIVGSLQILSGIVEDYAMYPPKSEAEKNNLITSIRSALDQVERYNVPVPVCIRTEVPA